MKNLSKILAIAKENNLFWKNEFILISSSILFTFITFMFTWNIWFVNDFKEMAYVSLIWLSYLIISNIAIAYFSIMSLSKDIEWKYIYFILKSTNRLDYILWKFLSIIFISLKINFLFWIIFLFFYKIAVWKLDLFIIYIPLFQLLETLVIASFSILITFIAKNNIARIFIILTFFLVWHVTYSVMNMINNWSITFWKIWNSIYWFFYKLYPNLEAFNVRDVILYNTSLTNTLISSTFYAFLWIFIFLYFWYRFFKKENL